MTEAHSDDGAALGYSIVEAWECEPCEVSGRSLPGVPAECWNCGGPVKVTARPAVRHVTG